LAKEQARAERAEALAEERMQLYVDANEARVDAEAERDALKALAAKYDRLCELMRSYDDSGIRWSSADNHFTAFTHHGKRGVFEMGEYADPLVALEAAIEAVVKRAKEERG